MPGRASRIGIFSSAAAAVFSIVLSAGTAAPQPAGLVSDERLLAANDETDADWIMFGQDYRNHRFSSLGGIDRDNVRRLLPAWIYQNGIVGSTQTHPVVVDGVMYFTTPGSDVIAANAATGQPVWRYRHKYSSPQAGSNRGVAVAYGRVFIATNDRRLIALDQATGEVIFDHEVERWVPPASLGEHADVSFGFRSPPLVFDGLVIVSSAVPSGTVDNLETFIAETTAAGLDVGEEWIRRNLGMRGFMAAIDAETGEEVWRFYLTKEDGWEGMFVPDAPDGTPLNRDIAAEQAAMEIYRNAWASAGTSAHFTPALDPATGTLFAGTGDPEGPFPLARPGDNLYSNGMIALDARTGDLRWFFQARPHGHHDDLISQSILMDVVVDGRTVAAVGNGSKTGTYYVVDRATGEYLFESEAFVPQINLFVPPTVEGVEKAPGNPGGMSVSPTSYDPNTGYAYVAAVHRPQTDSLVTFPAVAGRQPLFRINEAAVPLSQASGRLTALDLNDRGTIVWQVETPQPLVGGALATAGGLVFMGEANGNFRAYDSATGAVLWSFQTGGNVGSSAISYAVDGRQFVAVASGAAAPAEGAPIGPNALRPGGAMIAFALPLD